jgi:small subunit ribosomal protein S1
MAGKKIYTGRVISVHDDTLTISSKEYEKVEVKKDETELIPSSGSLLKFLGREVCFVLLGKTKEGKIVGSIKKATEKTLPAVIEALKSGKTVMGVVVGLMPFGAYVDIKGVLGLLKNKDFAAEGDYTYIQDVHKIGDKVKVKMKKGAERTDKKPILSLEASVRYRHPNSAKPEDYVPGQIVVGKVRQVKPDKCYVNIGPNLDAICPPPLFEIEEGMEVAFKINQVNIVEVNGVKRVKVRGKIKKAY